MSLTGRIEDLGLAEILQIVALSGKSGTLVVTSNDRTGKIYFNKGKVVRAFSDSYRVSLGEILEKKGYVTHEIVRKALEQQRESDGTDKLGAILINDYGILRKNVEEGVMELIENAVFSLFYWTEGDFQFQLSDDVIMDDVEMDPMQYDLSSSSGLSTQFLAMEGTRMLDENKLTRPDSTASSQRSPAFLLVDDYTVFREALTKLLGLKGHRVIPLPGVKEAKEAVEKFVGLGERFVVIVSLVMPRSDEKGVLGGVELLEIVGNVSSIPVIVLADHNIPDAQDRILSFQNARLLKKPGRHSLTKENITKEINFFYSTLETTIAELNGSSGQPVKDEAGTWDEELRQEFNMSENSGSLGSNRTVSVLKSMMAELARADTTEEAVLLILRFSSEVLPRGILFAVRQDTIAGIGQFGLERFVPAPLKMVRNLHLPLEGHFASVLSSGIPYNGPSVEGDEITTMMAKRLGGQVPSEIMVYPIIAAGRNVALLYADNVPTRRHIDEADAADIFFTQAGFVLEKALLKAKTGA